MVIELLEEFVEIRRLMFGEIYKGRARGPTGTCADTRTVGVKINDV
jgi:hypothetical protein